MRTISHITRSGREAAVSRGAGVSGGLPAVPWVVIPGNHDIGLTSLMDRRLSPFRRFRRYITDDLEPFYADAEVAIAGINTVRKSTVNDGRIKDKAARRACEQLDAASIRQARVVVTHHPVDVEPGDWKRRTVSRATGAMKRFAASGVDLFLSGHLHTGSTLSTSARYRFKG